MTDSEFHGVPNRDGTYSFDGILQLAPDSRQYTEAVMRLRGYPEGMDLKKYPREKDCEEASPGIVDAQSRCRYGSILRCVVTVDRDGNRTIHLKDSK